MLKGKRVVSWFSRWTQKSQQQSRADPSPPAPLPPSPPSPPSQLVADPHSNLFLDDWDSAVHYFNLQHVIKPGSLTFRYCKPLEQISKQVPTPFIMPSRIVQGAITVAMLMSSIPILGFALFTSAIALTVLSVRGIWIMVAFWLPAVADVFSTSKRPTKRRGVTLREPSIRNSLDFRPSSTRSRNSSMGDLSLKRASYASDSHLSIAGTPINRDFEGIGGWRAPMPDEDQSLWMNMKTRLDRNPNANRHHRRSTTGGSLASGLNSPEFFAVQARTPRSRPHTSGSASPQSYFNLPMSRSMVSLQQKRFSAVSSERWEQRRGTGSLELDRDEQEIGMAI